MIRYASTHLSQLSSVIGMAGWASTLYLYLSGGIDAEHLRAAGIFCTGMILLPQSSRTPTVTTRDGNQAVPIVEQKQ